MAKSTNEKNLRVSKFRCNCSSSTSSNLDIRNRTSPTLWYSDITTLKAVTIHSTGNRAGVLNISNTAVIFVYNEISTAIVNETITGDVIIKPDNIVGAGRWIEESRLDEFANINDVKVSVQDPLTEATKIVSPHLLQTWANDYFNKKEAIYVDSAIGSNSYDGRTPNRPKDTLLNAVSAMTSSNTSLLADTENVFTDNISFNSYPVKVNLPLSDIIIEDNSADFKIISVSASAINSYINVHKLKLTTTNNTGKIIYVDFPSETNEIYLDVDTIGDINVLGATPYAIYINNGTVYLNAKEIVGNIYIGGSSLLYINCSNFSGTISGNSGSGLRGRLGDTIYGEPINFNNFPLTPKDVPTTNYQVVNKLYVDSLITSTFWDDVAVATTTNVNLTTDLENGDTIDGYILNTGDRVLVKNQTDATENGLYTVPSSGAASRSTDANIAGEITNKKCIPLNGTLGANQLFFCTTSNIILGSTDIFFASLSIPTEHNNLSGLNDGDYKHLTSIEYTDLTDAGDSALHYHNTDRNRSNHTGTQTANTISDFDAEVSNNIDVIANTIARHDEDHNARHILGGADEIEGDKLNINFNPSNYTPNITPSEVNSINELTAHLSGLDNEVANNKLIWLSFSKGDNSNDGFTINLPKQTINGAKGIIDSFVLIGFDSESQSGLINTDSDFFSKIILPNTQLITNDNTDSIKLLDIGASTSDPLINVKELTLISTGNNTTALYSNNTNSSVNIKEINAGSGSGANAVYVNSGSLYLNSDIINGDIYVKTGSFLYINCLDFTGSLINNGTIKGRIGDTFYPSLAAGTDENVKVSSNDTTSSYLVDKIINGLHTTRTANNDGGNETIRIDVTGALVDGSNADLLHRHDISEITTSSNWKIFYSSDDGTMGEVPVGNENEILVSTSTTNKPAFKTKDELWVDATEVHSGTTYNVDFSVDASVVTMTTNITGLTFSNLNSRKPVERIFVGNGVQTITLSGTGFTARNNSEALDNTADNWVVFTPKTITTSSEDIYFNNTVE